MLTILGNRENIPQLYSFKPNESEQLDWSLHSVETILWLANADTIVLTPEMLTFMVDHKIPMFESKKDAKIQAKKLPESQWRYLEIYIPCVEPNYSNSWKPSIPKSKRWKG